MLKPPPPASSSSLPLPAVDDPVMNCLLAICCPPLSSGQVNALTQFLVEQGVVESSAAETCAKVICANFDLAPFGTLHVLKSSVAALARGQEWKAK